MSEINCHKEMAGFHQDEVTLSPAQQADMRVRRDAGRTRLETGLDLNAHPQPKQVASQGSYQMRTMIQDDENEYDIDDGAYFNSEDVVDANKVSLTPPAARERVCDALKWDGRLKHEAVVKRNCVRQEYPQGYHIDVPVYRIVTTTNDASEKIDHFELASGDEWVKSDARAVTRWFNGLVGELNAGESDGSLLRRVTKLTKKLARSRSDWKEKTTSGISISKLVVDNFVFCASRDDDTLRETWKAIQTSLFKTQEVHHPVLLDSKLAEHGDEGISFFEDCLGQALCTLEMLDKQDCDYVRACKAWDDVFNTTYFTNYGGDGTKKSEATPFVVTSNKTARRDDGGGRFG